MGEFLYRGFYSLGIVFIGEILSKKQPLNAVRIIVHISFARTAIGC